MVQRKPKFTKTQCTTCRSDHTGSNIGWHLFIMTDKAAILALYRRLVRDANKFELEPIKRKLKINYRTVIQLDRGEIGVADMNELLEDGEAALRVTTWLRTRDKACSHHPMIVWNEPVHKPISLMQAHSSCQTIVACRFEMPFYSCYLVWGWYHGAIPGSCTSSRHLSLRCSVVILTKSYKTALSFDSWEQVLPRPGLQASSF